MTLIYDLFCGAGGASVGLARHGGVLGFDFWADACTTHLTNGHPTIQADLNTIDWSDYAVPDVLWASPPCQPFSAAGKQAGVDDPRDGLPAFLRAVQALLPPIICMENVKGLTHRTHLHLLGRYLDALEGLGYAVDWRVLNTADFGVPQTRERLILIARRDGGPLVWPRPTHAKVPGGLFDDELPWVSMADALGWSGTVGFSRRADGKGAATEDGPDKEKLGGSAARAALYKERDEGRWVLNTGKDWKKGGTRMDAQQIPVEEPSPTVNGANGGASIWWFHERPATTVSGDPRINPPGHKRNQADDDAGRTHYNGCDGKEAIRVTAEEAAILQGFPPGYVFTGSRTSQFQQIGNAVPPRLADVVVGALLA